MRWCSALLPGFVCPSDGPKKIMWTDTTLTYNRPGGNYVVNWGNTNYGQFYLPVPPPGNWYPGVTPPTTVSFGSAPFMAGSSSRLDDITDGTSNTLMMSEVVGLRDDSPTNSQTGSSPKYQGPVGDITFATGGQTFNGSLTPNSITPDYVCTTSSGWLTVPFVAPVFAAMNGMPVVSPTTPWNTPPTPPSIAGVTTPSTWTSVAGQQFAARSKHTGGVNAVFCDGSERFVTDAVDPGVWMALSTSRNAARWQTPNGTTTGGSTTARVMPVEPLTLNTN